MFFVYFRLLIVISAAFVFGGAAMLRAESQPIEIISWAPTIGAHSNWYEALEGLKAGAAMFNANGGIAGRELLVMNLDDGERNTKFLSQLATLAERPNAAAVVGGPIRNKGDEISGYLRRINMTWFGPWTPSREIYRDDDHDPLAILPTWREEMPALLNYIKRYYNANPRKSGQAALVYVQSDDNVQMANFAAKTAAESGLDLKKTPLSLEFSDWTYLAELLADSKAIILWLPCGSAAALIRELKILNPDRLFMTSSINATNENLVLISNGAWNGIIFPAIVIPSEKIHRDYKKLLKKYGAPGLKDSYQALVGLCQGQILAKALTLSLADNTKPLNLRKGFYDIKGFDTLLHSPVNYSPGQHISSDLFYLARAYGAGKWAALPDPASEKNTDDEQKQNGNQ